MHTSIPVMDSPSGRFSRRAGFRLLALFSLLTLCVGVAFAEAVADEGFGVTAGGAGQPVIHVTSLADGGAGTLREALGPKGGGGSRTIVFDVAGEIALADFLYVNGPFVTIDGTTAPSPGITLRNYGLIVHGSRGAHDVIIRGLRVRGAAVDGIQIASAADHVIVDHCSVSGSGDGNIDITDGSHDVTVAWTILARPQYPEKNMLIKYNASRITLHHNLYVASQRNPLISIDDTTGVATDTTVDMRNNVVWDWRFGSGTVVRNNAWANVVENFYGSLSSTTLDKGEALIVCPANCFGVPGGPGRAYVAENFNDRGPYLNDRGTEPLPFAAPPVTTEDACQAAYTVKAHVGVRPLDTFDAALIARLTPPPCKPDVLVSNLRAPASTPVGGEATVTYTVMNAGAVRAAPFKVAFSLSLDSVPSSGDTSVAIVNVDGGLGAGERRDQTLTFSVPPNLPPRFYRLLAVADPERVVTGEITLANNVTSAYFRIIGPDLAVYTMSAPGTVDHGSCFPVADTIGNHGGLASPPTVAQYYLSKNRALDATDVYLGDRVNEVPFLAPSARSVATTLLCIPPDTSPGSYYVIAVADAAGQLVEANEADNFRSFPITVR